MLQQVCLLLLLVSPGADSPLPPEKAFEIALPEGDQWETLLDEPLHEVAGTYCLAVADRERRFQLSVIVMPRTQKSATLQEAEKAMEKGFLKKATRKKSAEHVQIGGQRGYKVVAALDGDDGTSAEVVGIFFLTADYSFTLGIAKPGEKIAETPEAKEFLNSFKILKSPPAK